MELRFPGFPPIQSCIPQYHRLLSQCFISFRTLRSILSLQCIRFLSIKRHTLRISTLRCHRSLLKDVKDPSNSNLQMILVCLNVQHQISECLRISFHAILHRLSVPSLNSNPHHRQFLDIWKCLDLNRAARAHRRRIWRRILEIVRYLVAQM